MHQADVVVLLNPAKPEQLNRRGRREQLAIARRAAKRRARHSMRAHVRRARDEQLTDRWGREGPDYRERLRRHRRSRP